MDLAVTAEDQNIGAAPLSVAATAIYMASNASGVKLPQHQIAKVSRVSEGTISKCYKLMRQKLIYCFNQAKV